MSGPFDFIHLKGRTKGSSNELSFDVLDAASHGITEGKKSRSQRVSPQLPSTQGPYHGVKGDSALSSAPEVKNRKRARRSRAIRNWVIGILGVVVLVGLASYGGYVLYQGKMNFNRNLDSLIGRLSEVDSSLVETDALMKNPLTSAEAESRKAASSRYVELEHKLSQISDDAKALAADFQGDEAAAFAQASDAANARIDMLKAANDTFTLSSVVNEQKSAANAAWNMVLSADSLAREASEMANTASTEEATEQARAKTEQARSSFMEAREALVRVEKSVKDVSYADEIAYIDKRLEALDAALATSDALLANNREAAAISNSTYNKADLEATALAQNLPPTVDARVEAAFADELRQCTDAYSSARAAVANADAALRRFKG